MKEITVLTPAYNRAELLKRLYHSLTEQTNQAFVWLLIDDGSRDGTDRLIAGFQAENRLDIQYVKQVNGGKHRALNRGIGLIETPLTFIVDSDDYLMPEAVAIVLETHHRYRKVPDLCGYSFLRIDGTGKVNTAYFPRDGEIDTFRKVRINEKLGGDKAEVFYTATLREYPFPEFDGEKFLPEDVVWMRLSEKYKMVHLNREIYVCDYLAEGLTKTGRKMKIHSPRGMMCRSLVYLQDAQVINSVKIKMMILYIIYGRFAKLPWKEMWAGVPQKSLLMVLYPLAALIQIGWKRKYEKAKSD